MTGGRKSQNSVEVYNVDTNEWQTCPSLNKQRSQHSSCVLGNKLYVCSGWEESSIEVADCSELINGTATWETLSVTYGDSFGGAWDHVFCPISSHEIVIMLERDISIFDTSSNTMTKVGSPFKKDTLLSCSSNQAAMSKAGQIVALVKDSEHDHLKMVSYTKGKKMTQEIKGFGNV